MAETEPTYEAARAELREIVQRLEAGGQSLEESLALWERGEQLADVCRRWLDGATARLDAAITQHDAAITESEHGMPADDASISEPDATE
jgi:exodeoxyribonuclease VII small subunit